ncbi:hypothetical protein OBBRIDRAFT_522639 [Obba rivulosa]|uniref:Uncharacterized protein n=1 Tax=Obba rivulosa TaxID=1052685 RepID=A0A8E2AVT6_9APHY|nr:hypothetical protein OBBRIDRAFT_522639 [Obba rivulosa]
MHHRFACRHPFYTPIVNDTHEMLHAAWTLPYFEVLANLASYATRCIADGPFGLRELLIELQEKWDAVAECASAAGRCECPIYFTPTSWLGMPRTTTRRVQGEREPPLHSFRMAESRMRSSRLRRMRWRGAATVGRGSCEGLVPVARRTTWVREALLRGYICS